MRILIADDNRAARLLLSRTLERWNFEVAAASDGETAWAMIADQRPSLLIANWMMPGLDGANLCRRLRRDADHAHVYILLLSAKDGLADVVAGLDAGADDYLIKPFDMEELRARVNVGIRVALSRVRRLDGLLSICCYCKRIRSDEDYWQQIESYIAQHFDARFTHGICPACLDRAFGEAKGA